MKKNPSWERSKNASSRSGVLSCDGSDTAAPILSPDYWKWGPAGGAPRYCQSTVTGVCLRDHDEPADHDAPGHRGAMNRAVVAIGAGMVKRHRIAVARMTHDHAVPEDRRGDARGPDAVRARRAPGPGDRATRVDRVHGGVLTPIRDTTEEVVPHADLSVGQLARLAIDKVVHDHEVLGAARAYVDRRRAQRRVTAGDHDPSHDRYLKHGAGEREQMRFAVIRGSEQRDPDVVRVEELDRG